MTMTESASPTKKPPTRSVNGGNGDSHPALADQFVLSSAGVASQGLSSIRRAIDGAVVASDTIVLGLLDVADSMVQSNVGPDLASRSIAVARAAWSTGTATARQIISEL